MFVIEPFFSNQLNQSSSSLLFFTHPILLVLLWQLKYPSALNSFEKIINYAKSKKIAMFLDYDGTLSPIVDDPDRALMSDAVRNCCCCSLRV